jgi:hypothetical protein
MQRTTTPNAVDRAALSYRATLLALVVTMLVPPASAHAQNSGPVVWVDKRVSLQGRRVSSVLPVVNESKFEIPDATLAEIRQSLELALRDKGLLVDQSTSASSDALRVRTTVISFKTGDPASRWLGFGLGAASCTIRVQLLEPNSTRYVADVVHTRVVDSGGFFTIGADNSIHREVSAELAGAVARLLKGGG